MILFDHVSKNFQNKHTKTIINSLSDITLYIPQGEAVGLIGRSGAGKTTFLKLICGLIMPDYGRVRVCGLDPVNQRRILSKDISVLSADAMTIYGDKTVKENFDFIRGVYRIENKVYNEYLSKLIHLFNIESVMNDMVGGLSKGFRRRAELTALFLIPSKLIIMDEPCIGLDALGKEAFEEVIKYLISNKRTIIISSHSMYEIDSLCSRIIVLNQGAVRYYGHKDELYRIFLPVDRMFIKYKDRIPDMQDLPLIKYNIDKHEIVVSYDTNKISAAEIIRTIIQTAEIEEVKIKKPSLDDIFTTQ